MTVFPIVNFSVETGLNRKERQTIERQVFTLSGVFNVKALAPDAKSETVRAMYYAQVRPEADINKVLSDISAIPGVARASLPSPRRLL